MKYYIGPAPRFLGFPLVAGSIWWFWILVLAAMHIELCALAQWIVVRIGTPSLHLRQRGVAGTSLAVVIASSSIALVPLAGFASCVNVAWEEITRASSFAGTAGLDLTWAARGSIAAAFTISYLSAVWSITRRACSRWAKSNHLSPPSIHNAALCLHCGYPIGGAYSCPECGSPDPRQLPPALYMPWELRLRGRSTRHIPRLLFWAALISLYCAPWILGTIRSIPQ